MAPVLAQPRPEPDGTHPRFGLSAGDLGGFGTIVGQSHAVPAAAHRLIERDRGQAVGERAYNLSVLGGEELSLAVEDGKEADLSLAIALLRFTDSLTTIRDLSADRFVAEPLGS